MKVIYVVTIYNGNCFDEILGSFESKEEAEKFVDSEYSRAIKGDLDYVFVNKTWLREIENHG